MTQTRKSARGSHFRRAGPQQRVYFQPDEVNTAIFTCSGLCPGLNTVIRELVCGLYNMYGVTSVIGIEDALEPYLSRKAVELHWGKHQQDYADGIKKQLAISPLYGHTLEDLIKETYNNGNPLPESNDAAEVWNHHFWESMQPEGGGSPEAGVLQQIEKNFGSLFNFKEEFMRSALSLLGSGWVWLVLKRSERKLAVVQT